MLRLLKIQMALVAMLGALSFVTVGVNATSAGAAGDVASGGADSGGPGGAGSGPYNVAYCSLYYDDYFGQIGYASSGTSTYEAPGTAYNNSWYVGQGYINRSLGHGAGSGAYFFMNGPGSAPAGTSNYNWGVDQAFAADVFLSQAQSATGGWYTFGFIFADIEGTRGSFGWVLDQAQNQQVWDGFYQSLQANGINVGVYSAPAAWSDIMAGQTVDQVEWTYQNNADPNSPYPCPSATFSGGPGGINAAFFNFSNRANNLVWQWSIRSGLGDYDQINLSRYNSLFHTSYSP